jgi:hypothetical protein
MRPLPNTKEWALELLAGTAKGVAKGTVKPNQLEGTKRMALRWGADEATVETTIATKKPPKRAGEI